MGLLDDLVEGMLEIVAKDMSDAGKAKRINSLDYLLSGKAE